MRISKEVFWATTDIVRALVTAGKAVVVGEEYQFSPDLAGAAKRLISGARVRFRSKGQPVRLGYLPVEGDK